MRRRCRRPAFTLVEILVTLTIVGALVGGVYSLYDTSVENARVQQMRANLKIIKQAIEQYHARNGSFPTSLEVLTQKYLTQVPDDPLTSYTGNDWLVIGPTGNPMNPNDWKPAAKEPLPNGIFDVKSSSGF